ncbi:NADase-type glycan-binding domain-containing protein [uncultured Cohaesibacter sp.]|uniref:NADase-type glycan-binding domain-containing protein n=1 Tax=uncultured Cohaesibacter sp. TaxID=1002546 RepID=UPI0029310DFD|nr:hypothetical protein [uncultured Cohaesibacter sp.]
MFVHFTRGASGSLASFCVFIFSISLFGSVAKAADCDHFNVGTDLVDSITYCASSVLPNSKVATYRPGNLDGWEDNVGRAWCEGAYGNGSGEWIEYSNRPESMAQKVYFWNGYQKSKKAFQENARARDVKLQFDDGTYITYRLQDKFGQQVLAFPNGWKNFTRIRMTINSVYPGSKYDDLCISGFAIDYEESRYADPVVN